MEKKLVKDRLEELDVDDFGGPIDEAIRFLLSKKEKYNTYSDVTLDVYRQWEDLEISLYGTRLETDEEFEKRKARSNAAKAAANRKREEKERKERLKRHVDEKKERDLLLELLEKYPDVVPAK